MNRGGVSHSTTRADDANFVRLDRLSEMTNQTQRIVFISYSHADSDFVDTFEKLIRHLGITPWKDSKDLRIGGDILDSLKAAIESVTHFCCIISSSSAKSSWVKIELDYAKQRQLETNLLIVPILIDEMEIPDYLESYRCARLQRSRLSLDDPELIITLRAFGVDLADAPRIITGLKRRRLLRSCGLLQERLIHFRQKLVTFQERYEAYRTANLAPRTIMVRDTSPRRRGIGSRVGGGRKSVSNPDYFKIKPARQRARTALIDLSESSSWMPDPLEGVKQALKDAGLTKSADEETLSTLNVPGVEGKFSSRESYLWEKLEDVLDEASTISKAIFEVPANEGEDEDEDDESIDWAEVAETDLEELWWTDEKLPRWIRAITTIQATLHEVMGTVEYWGRFDSDK